MEQLPKPAVLDAIAQQGTLSAACVALKLDRRMVSRWRHDDGTFNEQVIAALATARKPGMPPNDEDDNTFDEALLASLPAFATPPPELPQVSRRPASSPTRMSPVPEEHDLPNQSLINVPGQREPLPEHERRALPPGVDVSGEEPKVQPDPVRTLAQARTTLQEMGMLGTPPGVTLPERPADLYPPVAPLRVFPPRLSEALWRVIDEVRANPTYARNLQVRLAVFQGGDSGPLAGLIDAMREE